MDFTPYILSCIGALVAALVWVAFNRPKDYLDVIYPLVKTLNIVVLGLWIGVTVGINYSIGALTPLVNVASGGPTALSHLRDFGSMTTVGFLVFCLTDIGIWYLATVMKDRPAT